MNAKRTALLALTAAALCCALAGCTSPFDAARSAWLYDDDEAIAQQDDAYSVVLYGGPQLDGASTLEGIHIGGLSGSMTLLAFDVLADGGDLAISCDLEAVHGDIKLAFVAFDDEQVETLCEGEASGGLARTLAPGRYALKVVAACRGGADVTVQANASDGVEAFIPGDALDDSPIPVALDPLEA